MFKSNVGELRRCLFEWDWAGSLAGGNIRSRCRAPAARPGAGVLRAEGGDLDLTALRWRWCSRSAFCWLNAIIRRQNSTASESVAARIRTFWDVPSGAFWLTPAAVILVDAGAGTWWGGPASDSSGNICAVRGYPPDQVDLVLITHLHRRSRRRTHRPLTGIVSTQTPMFFSRRPRALLVVPENAARGAQGRTFTVSKLRCMPLSPNRPTSRHVNWHSSAAPRQRGRDEIVRFAGHTPGTGAMSFALEGPRRSSSCATPFHASLVFI